MKPITQKLLIEQGYDLQTINQTPNILALTKWTPFACATFGLFGVILQSPAYFFILAACVSVGAFTNRSFFDWLYKYLFSHIFKWGEMPEHKIQRKIGCGMGACAFIVSGIGFYIGNPYMSYIPSLFMVTFAYIAGFFNWCFVSCAIVNITKK